MKIAQFPPLAESVPPVLYGGIERAVSYLTEELVLQGHEVVLFASGDSHTNAELVSCCSKAMRLGAPPPDNLPDGEGTHRARWYTGEQLALLWGMRGRLQEFDVLHFHTDLLRFAMFRELSGRAVTTLHLPADSRETYGEFFQACPNAPIVSLSHHQRLQSPGRNWMGTVHYGIPLDLFDLNVTPSGGYLAFLGNISPVKGPDHAIEIARRTGIPLKIAAKIGDTERTYFERCIRPLIDGARVEFLGEIGGADKRDFLANARALLFPITWSEPFGLVMIEAMACGTPVVGFPRGSVPEVIDNGVTGFVVADIEEAVEAVGRLETLDRRTIRERFVERFSVARMTQQYLEIYTRLQELPVRSL